MNYYWAVWLAAGVLGLFFIWRMNIFVRVSYLKNPGNHLFSISVLLFRRFKLYTFKLSPPDFFQAEEPEQNLEAKEKDEAAPEKREKLPANKNNFKVYYKLLNKFVKCIYFEKLSLKLIYGFEDAALTGISAGLLAAFKEFFLIIFGRYFKIKEAPDFSFLPTYGHDRLEAEFRCIFRIRLGNVIAIAASMAGWPKFGQGGEAQWLNTPFKI